MNLPNKLTVARIYMIPLVICSILLEGIIPYYIAYPLAAALFGITSFTDFLDGKLARKHNLITDFGKFLDPLADKLLVIGTLLTVLYKFEVIRPYIFWALMAVIFRELTVTGLRLLAVSSKGEVIAANMLGKIKTVTQIVCILVVLLEPVMQLLVELTPVGGDYILHDIFPLSVLSAVVMTFFTLLSGIVYLIKYGKFLNSNK